MRYLVLGPLEVHGDNGPIAIGSPKERRLLAVLLTRCGETLSPDFLVDAVWGSSPPRSAAKTLQGYVVHLRKALNASAPGAGSPIVTRPSGYALDVAPTDVDAQSFRALVTAGQEAAERSDLVTARLLLEESLGLWRGAAYVDFTDARFAMLEARALEELKMAALEQRIDVDLATGGRADLVAELEALTERHATRERMWTQLIHALYQEGRQADALAAYQRARRVLLDELGLEPGPELRDVQAAVLRQDPTLHATSTLDIGPPPPGLAFVGSSFEGRTPDMDWLRHRWARTVAGHGGVVVLSGPSGVGKSRLMAQFGLEVHGLGGAVTHLVQARTPSPAPLLAASGGSPVLVLVDEPLTAVTSTIVAGDPVLVVVAVDLSLAPAHLRDGLRGAEHWAVEPLSDEVGRRVVRSYETHGLAIDVDEIVARSSGLPGLLHDIAADEVERAARGRIDSAVRRSQGDRASIASTRKQMQRGLLAWQQGRAHRSASAACRPAGAVDGLPPAAPFKGLQPFEQADSAIFHGRDALIATALTRVSEVGLVAVIGSSGAGKSSLVKAGLLSSLADGSLPGSAAWVQHVITPRDPFPCDEDNTMVLVVDQVEEAWTSMPPEARVGLLDGVVDAAERGHHVILTIRADFVDRCAEHPRLSGLVGDGTVLVGPMTDEDVRRAVVGPAEVAGLEVDPRLVEQLVLDARQQPGALPLMSAALVDTWERRTSHRLTLSAYRQAGGVSGAVARMAEETYGGLSESVQTAARRLFVRLAAPTEDGVFVRRRVALAELDGDDDSLEVLDAMVTRRLLSVDRGSVEVAHEVLFAAWPRLSDWLADDEQGRQLRRGLSPAALEWARGDRSGADLYRGVRLDAVLERFAAHPHDLTLLEREFVDASHAEARREISAERERAEREARGRRRLRVLTTLIAASLVVAVAAALVALQQRRQIDEVAQRAIARQLGSAALVEDELDRSLLLAASAVRVDDSLETRGDLLAALQRSPAALQVRRGDGDRLLQAALSSDGETLVVGDNNGTVTTWDAEGSVPGSHTQATENGFVDIAARPGTDEIILSSLGTGGPQIPLLIRWDPIRQQQIGAALSGARTPLDSLTWSPDGRWLAANQDAGDVLVWDFNHLRRPPVHVPTSHERFRLMASAGGRDLAVVEEDGAVAVWRPGERRARVRFGIGAGMTSVASTRGGAVLAVGHADGSAQLWDARTGKLLQRLSSHSAAVRAIAVDDAGSTVATLSDDRTIMLSDVSSGRLRETWTGHSGAVTSGVFSGDGDTLFTTSLDGSSISWDVTGERRLGSLFPHSRGVDTSWSTVSMSGVIAVAQPSGRVRFWDEETRRPLGGSIDGGQDGIIASAFSPDGEILATAGPGASVGLWDVAHRSATTMTLDVSGDANEISFSPDGRLLAVCVWTLGKAKIVILDAATRRQIGDSITTGFGVTQLAWSPDSSSFAVASWESPDVRVYDARSHQLTWRRQVSTEGTSESVAWSPDGARVAAGDAEGRLLFWDAETGRPQGDPLEGHAGSTVTTAYSPNGSLLATAATDGRVIIRDGTTGQQLGVPLRASDDQYTMARFDAEGRLFVASGDGSLWLWDMAVSAWLDRACATAGRELTRSEWDDLDTSRGYVPAC